MENDCNGKNKRGSVSLDDIDRKMISLLRKNGRMSNIDLATQVGLSPPPCLRRLKVLEKEEVITGYKAKVDYGKLGYEVRAMLLISLNFSSSVVIREFIKKINESPNVIDLKSTIDSSDFVIFLVSKDLEDYRTFLKTYVQDNRSVRSLKSYIISDNIF